MGWFDEQIRRRKEVDENALEDALYNIAASVTGGKEAPVSGSAKNAIDEIMGYFGIKPVDIPASVNDEEEQIRYCFGPNGVMYRRVKLTGEWFKVGFGPLLVRYCDDGEAIAIFPKNFGGYSYVDYDGKRININEKVAERFEEEAYCFYKPFPQKKLGIPDLILFLKRCLDIYDVGIFVFLTFLATIVGMLLPKLTLLITGFVLDEGSISILGGTFAFIVCIILSTQIIEICKDHAECI